MRKRVLIAAIAFCVLTTRSVAAGDLAKDFVAPPDSAKPRVYWWWLKSRVSQEGITRDLEQYRAKGIGGVLLFDAGGEAGPMPSGPRFMSPEWRELFKHALREADRLGIEVSVNLCSGWDAGGPWITPEHAAKQFVQSELGVTGPQKLSAKLPQPPGNAAFYRDVAVQAFREKSSVHPPPQPRVTASSSQSPYPPDNAADANEESFWVSNGLHPGDAPTKQKPEWLRFDFPEPITIKMLHLIPRTPFGPREIEVQVSGNGQKFTTVKACSLPNQDCAALPLPPTTSRIFRILVTASYAAENAQIAEVYWGDRRPNRPRPLLLLKSGRDSSSLWGPQGSVRALVEAPLAELEPSPGEAPIDPGTIVDLTSRMRADWQLAWDVPEGDWTIVRTGYTITGAQVSGSNPGGGGFEMDWFNAAAMDHHFRSMAELLCQDAGPLVGKTLKYFHDDSWEVGLPNWTHGFLEEFQKYRGYDARPYLPVLAGRIVGSVEVSDRFLHDFRKTVADCLAENHYARFAALAHARGMKIHCEGGGPCWPKVPPMDALKNLGRCDIPMGEFWQSEHWKENGQNQAAKEIACAAHIYGRTYVAAEAFTKMGHYQESPADLKPTADIALCEGINRFVLHTSTSSRPEDGNPGYEYSAGTHFNRNVTWWNQSGAWLAYLARCQHLLQQGLFAADVCYYSGDNAPNFVEPKHVDPSLGPGYDYDVCNADVLLTRMSVKDGRIVLPDGMSYRLLVLPDRKTMPAEVLKRVKELVEAGATVVGPRPQRDPGLKDFPRCDDEVRRIAAELWGEVDGTNITQRRVGRGRIVWGRKLREVLLADGVKPDFEHSGKNAFVDFIHRTAGEAEIYFVANRNNRWERVDCTFRVAGKLPEMWDPIQGTMRDAAAYGMAEGRTTLPLEFAPHGSTFVVFRKPASLPRAEGQNFLECKSVQEITGPWTVEFDPKWGGPNSVVFKKLEDWSKRTEDGIKFFSGTATYRKRFDLPDTLRKGNRRIYLDLGNVKNLADVRLNGASLGVVWTVPFRLDITQAVKPEGNRLEISVTNLWWNRLVGDAGLPENKRVAQTHVRLDKTAPLLESGLLGPVSLVAPLEEE